MPGYEGAEGGVMKSLKMSWGTVIKGISWAAMNLLVTKAMN